MIAGVMAGANGVPLGFQQQAFNGSAQSLPTIPAGATGAVIMSATVGFSWRDDGTAPTASIGMNWPVNTPLYYTGNLSKFQVLGTSGAGNNLNVSYYG